MILLIILIIIGAIIGAMDDFDPGAAAFFGAVFGAILAFVVGIVIGIAAYGGTHWKEPVTTPLVSLADGSDIHGRFAGGLFLSTGYVDSSPSYTWYEKTDENSYERKDVEASSATIHYLLDTDRAPYYTYREEVTDHGFWNAWGWNMEHAYGYHYDFYVPKGSIVQSYRLDNR